MLWVRLGLNTDIFSKTLSFPDPVLETLIFSGNPVLGRKNSYKPYPYKPNCVYGNGKEYFSSKTLCTIVMLDQALKRSINGFVVPHFGFLAARNKQLKRDDFFVISNTTRIHACLELLLALISFSLWE